MEGNNEKEEKTEILESQPEEVNAENNEIIESQPKEVNQVFEKKPEEFGEKLETDLEGKSGEIDGKTHKPKKKKLIIIVVLLAIVLSVTAFSIWKYNNSDKSQKVKTKEVKKSKKKKTKKETEEKTEVVTQEQAPVQNSIENVDVSSLTIGEGKVLNPEANGYSYSVMDSAAQNIGINLSTDKGNNTGIIELYWGQFHKYSTRYMQKNAQGGTYGENTQRITVNGFQGNVHAVYFGGFGQSFGYDTAFFVMKDGSVEYVPIQKLYDTCGYLENCTVQSYGKVPGAEGVAKVVSANYNEPYSTGAATTLGIKPDGSFYDFQFNLDVNQLRA